MAANQLICTIQEGCPLPSVQFLSCSCSFQQKYCKIIGFWPKLRGWNAHPHLGNSGCCTDLIITARKRSLRRLCFYTCLSFILFTVGEYLTRYPPHQVHTPPQTRYTPGPGTHPPEQTPPDQVHYPGTRYPRPRYTPPRADTPRDQVHPPEQSILGDTVNVRAVHILLERNLVCLCILRPRRRMVSDRDKRDWRHEFNP